MKFNSELQNFTKTWMIPMILLFCFSSIFAQEKQRKKEREAARFAAEAKKAMSDNDFPRAESKYREAIAKDPQNADVRYNLGNLYYTKEKSGEASERLAQSSSISDQKSLRHNAFHNQGNAFMKEKQYEKAVASYKNALRNDPEDDQTRYNLALAKKMLEKQKQDQKNDDKNKDKDKDQDKKNDKNKDKDKGKDGKDNKDDKGDKGDQKNKDDQKKNEPKDQDKKGDQKKDKGKPEDQDQQQPKQKEGDKKKSDQQQQPQAAKGKLSPQQMKNLLEAMENQERKIQDKINARKAKGQKTTTEKDW